MKHRYDAFRNPGLSVGWLFADLLLALAMIFLLANTLATPPTPEPIPTLTVSPTSLDLKNPACGGGTAHPRCTVTVGEAANSRGQLQWTASSDMSDSIVFSPANGVLSPGKAMSVTISAIPCQNGSITFSGSRNASPVAISWHCTPPVDRLNFKYQEFTLTVNDIPGMLSTPPPQSDINDIEHQVRSQRILQQSSAGLAIVYDGAPAVDQIGNARTIAQNVINILEMLGQRGFAFQRASYYGPLYALYSPQNTVTIDVYLFMQ